MRTLRYRLDHDLGFAPNPYYDWCTLACCMHVMRKYAELGDVIVGMAGSGNLGHIHPQLIYWMQVEDFLTFDEYWNDARFQSKKPDLSSYKMKRVGDNTYRTDSQTGEWLFENSMHHVPGANQKNGGHVTTDTKSDKVLVGQRFTYWGDRGPAVPDHLLELFPKRRHYKYRNSDPDLLAELHDLMGFPNPRYILGPPADWGNSRYFPKE